MKLSLNLCILGLRYDQRIGAKMSKLAKMNFYNRVLISISLFLLVDIVLSKDKELLVFEGMRGNYSSISEVEFVLRNDSDTPLNFDSFQVDLIVVQRQNEINGEWEEGNGFRCANAGVGTPRAIQSGGNQRIKLLDSAAFGPYGEPLQWFETEQGVKRDLKGATEF